MSCLDPVFRRAGDILSIPADDEAKRGGGDGQSEVPGLARPTVARSPRDADDKSPCKLSTVTTHFA